MFVAVKKRESDVDQLVKRCPVSMIQSDKMLLLEECYVLKDPFTSDKDKFLILGSQCSLCSKLVCVGPECSLFYSKRFCLPCVRENLSAFPQEIQQDVEKRHSLSRAASRKLDSRP
ncbi:cysteine-rich DPF motif domain-containing protein 1 isoform X3 [Notamacropus eugenii]|uniref:cysteine-rich DPF motif domain-containing protein 1 isoform X3 n=1 Tax=Notamacropus eugenii TaxID=9315 RepID=UPI003B66BD4A